MLSDSVKSIYWEIVAFHLGKRPHFSDNIYIYILKNTENCCFLMKFKVLKKPQQIFFTLSFRSLSLAFPCFAFCIATVAFPNIHLLCLDVLFGYDLGHLQQRENTSAWHEVWMWWRWCVDSSNYSLVTCHFPPPPWLNLPLESREW